MKRFRNSGRYAARFALLAYAFGMLVLTGAFAAVFVKDHGGDDCLQVIACLIASASLFPIIGWLVEKADLP